MIESIKLTRFKQFKDTEIHLQPFSVLMGENNSGKTSVLQAIWLALAGLHQGKLLNVDWKTGQARVSHTGYLMYEVPFAPQGDFSGLFYNRISREGQTYDENSGAMLQVTDEKGNVLRLHLRELFRNLNFKLLTPAQELRGPELQNYAPLYISGFAGLHFQEERIFPAMMEAKVADGNVDAIVRNIILDLKLHAPAKYCYLEQLLAEEFDFRIREVRFQENDERYVFSEYEELTQEASLRRLEFGSTGSGIMQILQTVAVILRYCPEKTRVVLIDEPEVHLHGNLQVRFLRILKKMQQELGIQMILATHSEQMIRNTEPQSVIPISAYAAVNRGLGHQEELHSVLDEQFDAYLLGKAKIGGKLAFFEGRLQKQLEQLADLLDMDCFTGMNTIPVIGGWQKNDDLPFDLKPVLGSALGREMEVHVICDADKLSEKETLWMKELAERSGVRLHVISGKMLRGLIKEADSWSGRTWKQLLEAEENQVERLILSAEEQKNRVSEQDRTEGLDDQAAEQAQMKRLDDQTAEQIQTKGLDDQAPEQIQMKEPENGTPANPAANAASDMFSDLLIVGRILEQLTAQPCEGQVSEQPASGRTRRQDDYEQLSFFNL